LKRLSDDPAHVPVRLILLIEVEEDAVGKCNGCTKHLHGMQEFKNLYNGADNDGISEHTGMLSLFIALIQRSIVNLNKKKERYIRLNKAPKKEKGNLYDERQHEPPGGKWDSNPCQGNPE